MLGAGGHASAVVKPLCGYVSTSAVSKLLCGCSTSVVRGLPKPVRWVRLPSPAPFFYQLCGESNPERVSALSKQQLLVVCSTN